MSRFTPDNESHKKALIERALKLKPKYLAGVIATDKGWSHPRPSGQLELLVSFAGLDALLGESSNDDQDLNAEPIEVQAEQATVEEVIEQQEESTEQEDSEPTVEQEQQESTEPAKKKGGRPKKKVSE